jgi:hypothetical protein
MASEPASVDDTKLLSTEPEVVTPLISESPHFSTGIPDQHQHENDFGNQNKTGNAEDPLVARGERHDPSLDIAHIRSIQPYQTWNRHPLPDPRGEPLNKVADRIVEIIEAEGPVLLHRIFHLYTNAAGIKRIGNQLRSLFLRGTGILLESERIEV